MDGYHHYTRPPPPPLSADPYHHYQYHQLPPQPPPPRLPLPHHGQSATPWYPNQFQYQSPSVPSHTPHPQQQQQWSPYPAQPPHFPPPPPPPPPHQYSAPYRPQEWSNPNWSSQQTWNVQAWSNAEEWAAKAKAWADSKVATNAMESQHAHSQYASVGENSHFYSQYQPAENSGYPDVHKLPQTGHKLPQTGLGNQQHPLPPSPQHAHSFQMQEGTAVTFRPSTYLLDGHAPFSAKDGTLNGASESHTQEPPPTNLRVHQQEVPSSNSSISGNEGTIDHHEKSSIFPISVQGSLHPLQPSVQVSGGPISSELSFAYGNQLAEPTKDLVDKPLQFAPGFPHQDNFTLPGYAYHVNTAATTLANSWTSTFVPEGDPSTSIPSPNTGHGAQSFGRLSGPNFPSTIQPFGGQFGLGVGAVEPPVSSFSIDAFTVSSIAERPKKAPVPSWLREEIIKTKVAITSMPLVNAKAETEIEDEDDDKSFKGDLADAKSIDSSKLTEDEDDDEDYVEAARTATINREIKRVLTEVLLKVTDEIFDEIATKVLAEDDAKADGGANTVASDQLVLESSYAATTPNFSEKVLDSVEVEKLETEDTSKSSANSSPNILGLANYASDDDRDENELRSFVPQNSVYKGTNTFILPAENGRSQLEVIEHVKSQKDSESDPVIAGLVDSSKDHTTEEAVFNSERVVELPLSSSYGRVRYQNNYKVPGSKSAAESRAIPEEQDVTKLTPENLDNHTNLGMTDFLDRQNTRTSGRTEGDNDKHCLSSQRADKEPDHLRFTASDREQRRNDERDMQKEMNERYDPKEPKREYLKSEERERGYRAQERKSSGIYGSRENTKDVQRFPKSIAREDDSRSTRRQKGMEKDRPAPALMNDSERYKRRRSSPDSSHGKNTQDDVNRARISSDEASDDSRRISHSRKRTLSPSPVRSRRRQVSRSPHSKRSQRRHSPYSSVETNRGSQSMSKSPSRRPL